MQKSAAQDVAVRPVARRAVAAATVTADTEYSGIVTRTLAFLIDAAIVNGVAVVVTGAVALILSVLPGSERLHALQIAIAGAAFIGWCIAYWTTFWTTTGQTPGDRAMRIRVTAADGSRLHVIRAVVRLAGIVAAAAPLFAGFVPIMLTDRRRGLQDWLADTVVTRAAPAPGDASLVSEPHDGHLRLPPR
jgi:uncharacterized RDD family membrane protein YckC